MEAVDAYIVSHAWIAWIILPVAFAILAKSADVFVDSSVALAEKLSIPKLVIGIVLVSVATTMPELTVSLMAALRGLPEMALGNAIGSVICNTGLALALAGMVAAAPIAIMPGVLKTAGLFLVAVELLAFVFVAPDMTLGRVEGLVLGALFAGYLAVLFHQHRTGKLKDGIEDEVDTEMVGMPACKVAFLFALGLAGILVAGRFIVVSATSVAQWAGIPESVISLSLVAFGTSVPEVATCVSAARKGHGDIAVGNILGANIMNICWVAGASATANPLTLGAREVYFMFPAMFVVVGVMLLLVRRGYRMTKAKALALLVLYAVFLSSMILLFPPKNVM
jgi:cation:H+ antiporter